MTGTALLDLLADESVLLDQPCPDWRAAIDAAGQGLVAAGAATPRYTEDMVEAVQRLGPYIVIAPGLAIAHARPSPAVLRTALSWVRPQEPVTFGHAKNDPVRLVVGLAALDHEAHQTALMEVATLFSTPGAVDELGAARDVQALKNLVRQRQQRG